VAEEDKRHHAEHEEKEMRKTAIAVIVAALTLSAVEGRAESLERKLRETVVRAVDFNDAQLRDVLAFLAEVSGEKLNIVVGGGNASDLPTVTLKLANVPLYDALRYTCAITGSEFRVDDNAVFITAGEGTPPNTYGVKLKVAPVEGEANQFMVEFCISEKQPGGEENVLSAPKITILAGQEGTVKVVDEGERNGVICTATVTPKANELQVDTSVAIKRDGKILWSCDQETTVASIARADGAGVEKKARGDTVQRGH
jgi:hypothetical protein